MLQILLVRIQGKRYVEEVNGEDRLRMETLDEFMMGKGKEEVKSNEG
jgi:hypothetical protein